MTRRAALMALAVLLGLSLSGTTRGQSASELAPREVPAEADRGGPFANEGERSGTFVPVDDASPVLVERLTWIELRVAPTVDLSDAGLDVIGIPVGEGLTLKGLTVAEQAVLEESLMPFLARPLTEQGLDQLISRVVSHYEANGRPVVEVYAPDQDLEGGVLVLEVIEGRVGAIGIETHGFFNDELLAGAVHLQQGEVLEGSDLQRHLDWYSRNPFRPASLYAAPGAKEGEVDLVFAFQDRRPWRVYAGYENSGAEAAGETRFLAGFNWGNAFGLDHMINYQFTMGDSFKELQAHAASWEIPIHPWHHFVRLQGGWAQIETKNDVLGTTQTQSGSSWTVGGLYGMQLPRWKRFKQEVAFGGEFKATDNFIIFGAGDSRSGTVVEIVQFRADYRATRRFQTSVLDLRGSLVGSPGGITGRNSDADFDVFRPGAKARYAYARANLTWLRQLPGEWALHLRGEGQLASGALLPTEQLAIGGHDTVRGYPERDYLADQGYILSAELRTPTKNWSPVDRLATELQGLVFLDHGLGWTDDPPAGQRGRESLTGLGAGLRVQVGSYLSGRLDLGVPLEGGDGLRAHAGVIASF